MGAGRGQNGGGAVNLVWRPARAACAVRACLGGERMTIAQSLTVLSALLALAAPAAAGPAAPLFQPWIDGVSPSEPQMQVQRYDDDTFVIRQSIRTNFEGPFLYLLFGRDRAILFDTGAGGLKIRPTVDRLVDSWLAAHHRGTIPLLVAHSHSHGDHHQGDAEFADRPDTTVVGLAPADVAAAFGIRDWPREVGRYDLGGRVLQVIPTPGHQAAAIMVLDERTGVLLTGDSLYPGRLYFPINHFDEYRDSLDRVVAATRGRGVTHLLGTHIEMTRTPGTDYPDEAPEHRDERVLELPYADLLELDEAVRAMGSTPRREVHADFIITPIPPRP